MLRRFHNIFVVMQLIRGVEKGLRWYTPNTFWILRNSLYCFSNKTIAFILWIYPLPIGNTLWFFKDYSTAHKLFPNFRKSPIIYLITLESV